MVKAISTEEAYRLVAEVKHPEINYTLVQLGMVKDLIASESSRVELTLLVPFTNIPIKQYLIDSLKEAIHSHHPGISVEVRLEEMNSEERERFVTMAKRAWTG
jgi:metal-sulfur cluster biosynthetic enzyme